MPTPFQFHSLICALESIPLRCQWSKKLRSPIPVLLFKLAFLSNRIDSPLQINHVTRMSFTNTRSIYYMNYLMYKSDKDKTKGRAFILVLLPRHQMLLLLCCGGRSMQWHFINRYHWLLIWMLFFRMPPTLLDRGGLVMKEELDVEDGANVWNSIPSMTCLASAS